MAKISVRQRSKPTEYSGGYWEVAAVDDQRNPIFGFTVTVYGPERAYGAGVGVMTPAKVNWSAIGSVSVPDTCCHIAVVKRAAALARRLNKEAGLD